MWMRVELIILGLDVEEAGNIDTLGVDDFRVDPRGIVSKPSPVIIGLADI